MIVAFLIVLNASVFANDDEKKVGESTVKVEVQGDDTFKLTYDGANGEKVLVKILAESGEVIFSETIRKHESFTRPYNFKELPKGIYTLQVVDRNGIVSKEINYGVLKPREINSDLNFVKVTGVNGQNDKYVLSIVNSGFAEAQINIFDNENHMVYSETAYLEDSFAQVYDVSLVGDGVRFEIEVDGIKQNFFF